MKQQFNLLILYCLSLTFFGCDSLHPADVVREQQQEQSFRSRENFGSDWQFQRLQDSLPSPREWDKNFLQNSSKTILSLTSHQRQKIFPQIFVC